jgi:hypothetical protein
VGTLPGLAGFHDSRRQADDKYQQGEDKTAQPPQKGIASFFGGNDTAEDADECLEYDNPIHNLLCLKEFPEPFREVSV